MAERLPEARWFELEHHGFMVLEVDAVQVRNHWYAIDAEDPGAGAEHCASWAHRREHPGRLEPVDIGDAPDGPLQPRSGPHATGPQVVVPARPTPVLDGGGAQAPPAPAPATGVVVTAAAAGMAAAIRHHHRT